MDAVLMVLIGAGLSVAGWFARSFASREKEKIDSIARKQEDQERKLQQLELQLARDYHDKDELAKMLDEKLLPIRDLLNEIAALVNAQSGFPLTKKV